MNSGLQMWLEGWKVMWRLFVFRLIYLLIASPIILLHFFIKRQLEEDQNSSGAIVYSIYAFAAIVIVFPFIFFITSRLRGEFIYPRYKAQRTEPETSNLPEVPEDSEPIHPENMKSWNPITGYNPNKSGEGLNPSSIDIGK